MFKIFSCLLIAGNLLAQNKTCIVDNSLLALIATIERHPKREIGYPYLISFNNKKDAKRVKLELGNELFLDNRTIDCNNKSLCKKITNYLVDIKKITNLDLGAYQLNYTFHKMKIGNYFSFDESYKKACGFIEHLINRYGYSWETIARYHSGTPKYNYAYLEKISKTIKDKSWN